MRFLKINLIGSASIILAACAGGPDLVVSRLDVAPSPAAAGGSLTINSEIANRGLAAAPVPDAPGSDVSTSVDIQLVETPVTPFGTFLTAWGPSHDLAPGASVAQTSAVTIPASVAPGDYHVCGDVDHGDHVAESDETNNRTCTPLTITAAASGKPDLVFDFVRSLHTEQASYKLDIVVRNVGSAPAGDFRVDAFQRAPRRWPVLLTSCPLTPAQRAAGGSAPCGAIWHIGTLNPGETWAAKMWVTMPMDRPAGSTEELDFMVDGCHPPLEPGLPVFCRVDESDETNNQAPARIEVP